jgi:hypothetical protein
MAIHPDALQLAARPRVGQRRLSNEPRRTGGLPGTALRVGLAVLAAGLLLLVVSTLAFVGDTTSGLYTFTAGAAAVVAGCLVAAVSTR